MKYIFKANENKNVLEFLSERISGVSLSSLKRLLRQREIKIEGKRISENILLKSGETVEAFIPSSFVREVEIVYEDENILVVNKPPFTSVTEGLANQLKNELRPFIVPLHRLDTNTSGLVVFAKNAKSEEILLNEFKNRTIEKKYRALTKNRPSEGVQRAYLFKDEKKSICYVSDAPKVGYKEILTKVKVIKEYKRLDDGKVSVICEVELTLITGRTHQLRAHLSHLNCPIIGDDKYGDYALNKELSASFQQLTAVSIAFDKLPPPLTELSGRTIFLKDFSFDKKLMERIKLSE